MLYNATSLHEYCYANNIQLLKTYDNVNRDNYIEGKCIIVNCLHQFNKTFRQMVKTGAYCINCMDKISKNKIRSSKVKWDINKLIEFCDNNNIILLEDYSNEFINRDSIIKGLCKTSCCENIFEKTFREILKLNGYCNDCSKEIGKNKIKETNLKKYGVECVLKCHEVIEKIKNTTILKYGVEHNSQSEEIKIRKKDKSLEKYGVEYVLQSKELREKIEHTNLIKYGATNPQQNEQVKNKTSTTNLERYGSKCYFQTEQFKNNIINMNLKKYGVPHHSQNPEIAEKMLKNAYNRKLYTLPSGKTIYIQGYENFMLEHLLFIENIDENDIISSRKEVPEIWFNDETGKRRRHYVDFYIKSQNRCVEVKSTWTNKAKNFVFEKQNVAKELGFVYEIFVLDTKGNILEKFA